MEEREGDRYLNIQTAGTQWISEATLHHNRYEPTPYEHLKELFNRHPMDEEAGVVDFGSGKGRMNFYVHDRFGCRTRGVELNTSFYGEAQQNLEDYGRNGSHSLALDQIRFDCRMAQEYEIQPVDTVFYFFNPFSVQIFMKVVDNILRSQEVYPRKVEIILYYPSMEYIEFLERSTAFELRESIDMPSIGKDPAEQFLIYQFSPQPI
ncbi:class I SAM-dependent methyltransferase [Planococcus salinarum]|uniref:class I SAM-dependent methyltransferase n=1 Tax=Planococcus salinarum TaxID=622695 RepID=UPI000E3E3F06|nr:class I SAM-dependent methyltransferase [Planococcus salinarum]TAA73453.1 class I SAM-dependent methyltransferase [Planococcus salinarum]